MSGKPPPPYWGREPRARPSPPPEKPSLPRTAEPLTPGRSGPAKALAALVVLVILVFSALYIVAAVERPQGTPPQTKPAVSLSADPWDGATDTVTVTSTSTTTLEVSTLTFQVIAANGTTYFAGPAGTSPAAGGVEVNLTYHDATADNRVGPDDHITVSVGLPSDVAMLHGTQFKVLQGTDVLGVCTLP